MLGHSLGYGTTMAIAMYADTVTGEFVGSWVSQLVRVHVHGMGSMSTFCPYP